MKKYLLAALGILVLVLGTFIHRINTYSKTASTPYDWTPTQRGEIARGDCEARYPNGHWLELPLDPDDSNGEKFSLFYFTRGTVSSTSPVTLQIAGGPGGIFSPEEEAAPIGSGGGEVLFHPRGAGCSQIPASNRYDRFLRSRYVVADIEALRLALKIEKWAAIFAGSAGTIQAHMYASAHPKHIGLLVLYAIANPIVAPQDKDMPAENLRHLLERNPDGVFRRMSAEVKKSVLSKFRTDLTDLAAINSVSAVLRLPSTPQLIAEHPVMSRGRPYLVAIENLTHSGWAPINSEIDRLQIVSAIEVVRTFAAEWIAPSVEQFTRAILLSQFEHRYGDLPDISLRVFQNALIYDGLKVWPKGVPWGRTIPMILLMSRAGAANDLQRAPYTVSAFRHKTPTFLIQGSADGISPEAGAHDLFENGLAGDKHLAILVGMGHHLALPEGCKETLYVTLFKQDWPVVRKLFERGQRCFPSEGLRLYP